MNGFDLMDDEVNEYGIEINKPNALDNTKLNKSNSFDSLLSEEGEETNKNESKVTSSSNHISLDNETNQNVNKPTGQDVILDVVNAALEKAVQACENEEHIKLDVEKQIINETFDEQIDENFCKHIKLQTFQTNVSFCSDDGNSKSFENPFSLLMSDDQKEGHNKLNEPLTQPTFSTNQDKLTDDNQSDKMQQENQNIAMNMNEKRHEEQEIATHESIITKTQQIGYEHSTLQDQQHVKLPASKSKILIEKVINKKKLDEMQQLELEIGKSKVTINKENLSSSDATDVIEKEKENYSILFDQNQIAYAVNNISELPNKHANIIDTDQHNTNAVTYQGNQSECKLAPQDECFDKSDNILTNRLSSTSSISSTTKRINYSTSCFDDIFSTEENDANQNQKDELNVKSIDYPYDDVSRTNIENPFSTNPNLTDHNETKRGSNKEKLKINYRCVKANNERIDEVEEDENDVNDVLFKEKDNQSQDIPLIPVSSTKRNIAPTTTINNMTNLIGFGTKSSPLIKQVVQERTIRTRLIITYRQWYNPKTNKTEKKEINRYKKREKLSETKYFLTLDENNKQEGFPLLNNNPDEDEDTMDELINLETISPSTSSTSLSTASNNKASVCHYHKRHHRSKCSKEKSSSKKLSPKISRSKSKTSKQGQKESVKEKYKTISKSSTRSSKKDLADDELIDEIKIETVDDEIQKANEAASYQKQSPNTRGSSNRRNNLSNRYDTKNLDEDESRRLDVNDSLDHHYGTKANISRTRTKTAVTSQPPRNTTISRKRKGSQPIEDIDVLQRYAEQKKYVAKPMINFSLLKLNLSAAEAKKDLHELRERINSTDETTESSLNHLSVPHIQEPSSVVNNQNEEENLLLTAHNNHFQDHHDHNENTGSHQIESLIINNDLMLSNNMNSMSPSSSQQLNTSRNLFKSNSKNESHMGFNEHNNTMSMMDGLDENELIPADMYIQNEVVVGYEEDVQENQHDEQVASMSLYQNVYQMNEMSNVDTKLELLKKKLTPRKLIIEIHDLKKLINMKNDRIKIDKKVAEKLHIQSSSFLTNSEKNGDKDNEIQSNPNEDIQPSKKQTKKKHKRSAKHISLEFNKSLSVEEIEPANYTPTVKQSPSVNTGKHSSFVKGQKVFAQYEDGNYYPAIIKNILNTSSKALSRLSNLNQNQQENKTPEKHQDQLFSCCFLWENHKNKSYSSNKTRHQNIKYINENKREEHGTNEQLLKASQLIHSDFFDKNDSILVYDENKSDYIYGRFDSYAYEHNEQSGEEEPKFLVNVNGKVFQSMFNKIAIPKRSSREIISRQEAESANETSLNSKANSSNVGQYDEEKRAIDRTLMERSLVKNAEIMLPSAKLNSSLNSSPEIIQINLSNTKYNSTNSRKRGNKDVYEVDKSPVKRKRLRRLTKSKAHSRISISPVKEKANKRKTAVQHKSSANKSHRNIENDDRNEKGGRDNSQLNKSTLAMSEDDAASCASSFSLTTTKAVDTTKAIEALNAKKSKSTCLFVQEPLPVSVSESSRVLSKTNRTSKAKKILID